MEGELMKRTTIALLWLLLLVSAVSAQQTGTAFRFRTGSNLPLTCRTGDVFYLSTGPAQYNCSATDTWTVVGGGGGGSPGGANTQVQFNDSGSFGGDAGLVYNKTTNVLTVTSGGVTLTSSPINKVTITPPATGSTLTIQDGFTLTVSGNATVSGTNTGDQTSVTGNAGTATALQTARNINGVAFDGTANITVTAAAGTLSGNTLASGVTASSLTSFGNSPLFVTPTLGVASATSINGLTLTSSTGTLTVANGKTATVSNTLTFTGTDSSSVAFGAGGTVVYNTRAINTTSPLGGGGDLSSDRTFTCTTCTTNASALTANLPVIGAGGNAVAVGTRSGNTTQFVTTTGTLTSGDCVKIDASGNFIANGSACGGSGGTPGGSNTQLQYNNSSAFGGISGVTSDGTNITAGSGNLRATSPRITTSILDANGNTALGITATASAVNAVGITNSVTGTGLAATRVEISPTGSDTNISLSLLPKGTSNATQSRIVFGTNGGITLWGDGDWQLGNNAGSAFGQLRFVGGFTLAAVTNIMLIKDASASTAWGKFDSSRIEMPSSSVYAISSNSDPQTAPDVAWNRVAPKVAAWGSVAGTADHWFQWAGEAYLATDQTNATATLASTTLSVTLQASRKYVFKAILYVSDDTAAEGVKADFGGGTATATNFRTHCTGFDTALGISTQVTSLTGTVSAGTFTGNGMIECHGSFEVNAGGTFIPRFAQNTHVVGTLTLFRGSHVQVFDTP
jgi:hypothetical protein